MIIAHVLQESFVNLNTFLTAEEDKVHTKCSNRVFYLALPPSVFMPVTRLVKLFCIRPVRESCEQH